MSDWEDAEVEIPVAPKFEDEELSDNEPLKPQQKLPPVKKKTDIKQKNLDREAEKLSKLNEVQETENERRIRLKNEVLDADLKNVIDLVGDLELPKSTSFNRFQQHIFQPRPRPTNNTRVGCIREAIN